jgi:N-acetylmuramoyl-L-alanine amidase
MEAMLSTLPDDAIVALTLYGEARGEGPEGRIAVANVVRNRMLCNRTALGLTLRDVCLRPLQFSCWNPGDDPNHLLLLDTAKVLSAGDRQLGPVLRECRWVARGLFTGEFVDNTHGATHYLTTALLPRSAADVGGQSAAARDDRQSRVSEGRMTPRLEFPGGSHPDALPTGARVVLFHGRHLETHRGIVPFPPGETFGVMFNRISPDGRKFAGLKHDGGGLAENTDGVWHDVPGPFAGTSPLIYDLNGRLIHDLIVYADGSVSSQGYGYIDEQNRAVPAQDTFATPDGQINRFSVYRGVIFGQGHEGGLVVRGPDGVTRLLTAESPFDIRVQGIGPIVAVSFWDVQPDGLCAYIYVATVAEYLALPPLAVPVPAPPPAPVPVPQPKPEPHPMPSVQNRDAALSAFWQQWNGHQPITDDAEKHRFTEALAGHLNALDGDGRWGRKARAGSDAKSKDTLGYWLGPSRPSAPTDGKVDAFDVIASSGAVSWDLRAEQNDPGYRNIDARWFPVAATSAPVPPPVKEPPAPSVDLSAVLAELAELRKHLAGFEEVQGTINGEHADELDALAQRVKALEQKPAPQYRVVGSTSRDYGHSHRINVTLEPIQ